MFCMLLFIGPAVDLFTLKMMQIPDDVKAVHNLAEKGYQDKGTQALIVQYEDTNNKEPKTI